MSDDRKSELQEVADEVEIILSVKDGISNEEIDNLINKFSSLSEYDIRSKIRDITGNETYVKEFIDKVNKETGNVLAKNDNELINEVTNSKTYSELDSNSYEADLVVKQKQDDNVIGIEIKEEIEARNNDPYERLSEQKEICKEEKEKLEKIIFDQDNIPEVSFIKAEVKYSQISLEWGWTKGIDRVLLSYRMDKFPMGPMDSSAAHILIDREKDFETGDYTMHNIIEGNYYFCIYTSVKYGDKKIFSNGQKRLIVNKEPLEIYYKIKSKRTILGKLKDVELIISTNSEEINIPQLVLVGKVGNMPIQKSDGENVFNIDYQTVSRDKDIKLYLPIGNIAKNMYVKLFFLDDSNSNVYRIISPAKEKLYLK